MLRAEGWTDVGAVAERWNQPKGEYTCVTAGANQATRRDYIFTNAELTPMVRNFRVVHDNNMPTHSTLDIRFDLGTYSTTTRTVKSPLSIYNLMRSNAVGEDGDPDNLTKEQWATWNASLGKYHQAFEGLIEKHQQHFDSPTSDISSTCSSPISF